MRSAGQPRATRTHTGKSLFCSLSVDVLLGRCDGHRAACNPLGAQATRSIVPRTNFFPQQGNDATRPAVVCAAPPHRHEGSLAALHRRAQALAPRQRVVEIALDTPLARAIPAAVASGEWFGMWMSKQWNGVPDAFRFFITLLLVLVCLFAC
nr:DUF2165 family protein [Burkholderia pyrrocinia]